MVIQDPLIISTVVKVQNFCLDWPCPVHGALGGDVSRSRLPGLTCQWCWPQSVEWWSHCSCDVRRGMTHPGPCAPGEDSWPRSVLMIVTWCWAPSSTLFSSGLLCREVRVGRAQKGVPEVTVTGRPCAPSACSRKCLALGISRRLAQLTCCSVLPPQLDSIHGTCIFWSLCWGRCSPLGTAGTLILNWPIRWDGLGVHWDPQFPGSQEDAVLWPNFLWYISAQNRMVSSDSLKSFWTTGVHWARSKTIQRNPVVFLGKASLGLQLWPSGPQPFLPVSSWFVGMTKSDVQDSVPGE